MFESYYTKVCSSSSLPSRPQLNASQPSTLAKSAQKHPATQSKDEPTTAFLFAEERTLTKSKANAQNRLTHLQPGELEAAKEKEVLQGHRRVGELWASTMGVRVGGGAVVRESGVLHVEAVTRCCIRQWLKSILEKTYFVHRRCRHPHPEHLYRST